jgi:formylglycine-generating enzyme required for sulfatase activity
MCLLLGGCSACVDFTYVGEADATGDDPADTTDTMPDEDAMDASDPTGDDPADEDAMDASDPTGDDPADATDVMADEDAMADTPEEDPWVECSEDAHCDDLDPCTTDVCTAGECAHLPVVCALHEQCAPDGRCMPVMVPIVGTTFWMGSPTTEPGHISWEVLHEVTLTHDFEIQTTEVTQAQFERVMGYNPSTFPGCGPDCPVEYVTWHEAAAYTCALSVSVGLAPCYDCAGTPPAVTCSLSASYASPYECTGYRLPTEAEWEYSARAGTFSSTYNGLIDDANGRCEHPNIVFDPIAWFCGNGDDRTHPVGGLLPNDWGLFDVHGNVWEWCHDFFADYTGDATDPWGPLTGTNFVSRGGGWDAQAFNARSATRGFCHYPFGSIGLRIARSI